MQDRVGEFQKLYVDQMHKFKRDLEEVQRIANETPKVPIRIEAFLHFFGELTRTIEALGGYVTIMEEELRKRELGAV